MRGTVVTFTSWGTTKVGLMMEIVKVTSVILPPQQCGKLDPTFASATFLFQKDPPANVQLFQVSGDSVWLTSGALAEFIK